MINDPIIPNEIIERLGRQEKKLSSAHKEVVNQWRGSLLIFTGLVITALSNQRNTYAYLLIVFWLVEALFILRIFWLNRNIYNLMINRHFEGTVSEEQEQCDIENTEKNYKQTRIYDELAFRIFLTFTFLTMIYFIACALGVSIRIIQ